MLHISYIFIYLKYLKLTVITVALKLIGYVLPYIMAE